VPGKIPRHPKETLAEELIRVAGRRWQVEDRFEQAKGEVGLDEYGAGSGRPSTGT
jgi:SRSO17 transposase